MNKDGEQRPSRDPGTIKETFRSHFDIVNSKLQRLRVRQKEQKQQYFALFEKSDAQTEEHRQFIKEINEKQDLKLSWVEEASEKYSKMMEDFVAYKNQTNEIIQKFTNKWES